jgi:hypothetical protein
VEDVIQTAFATILIQELEFVDQNWDAADSIEYNSFITNKTR